MEPRRTLARRAGMTGAVFLLLAAITACSGTGPVGASPAATVDGHRIYQDEVIDLADAQAAYLEIQRSAMDETADPGAAEQIDELLAGYDGQTIDTAAASAVVGTLVEIEILKAAVSEAGGEISETEREESRQALMTQLEGQDITDTEPFEALVKVEIERQLLLQKVVELSSSDDYEAQLQAAYEESAAELEELCVRLIATEDQAAAQTAYDRIQAGEDFSAVASEVSIDETSAPSGGDIGCVPRASIAGVFDDAATTAEPGDLLAPADGQGSWLVVQVDDTNMPTFEEAREGLTQVVPDDSEAAAQAMLQEAFSSAEVTLDPRYGTWDPDQGTVIPPDDPAPTTTAEVPMLDPAPVAPAGP